MKIIPAIGQAFVTEDAEDYAALQKTGLDIPEEAQRGVGTTGVIYSMNPKDTGYAAGQRVIFDRFIAQDIYIRDEHGKEIPRLRCLPVDCILGIIE